MNRRALLVCAILMILASSLAAHEGGLHERSLDIRICEKAFLLIPEHVSATVEINDLLGPVDLRIAALMPVNFFTMTSFFSEVSLAVAYSVALRDDLNVQVGLGAAPMLYRQALLLAAYLQQDLYWRVLRFLELTDHVELRLYGEGLTVMANAGIAIPFLEILRLELAPGIAFAYSWQENALAYGFNLSAALGVEL